MMRPGPTNSITDVSGLLVGNASDETLKSGVTVILPEKPCVASVSVLGGGPGTKETELLAPENSVDAVDAIVLSGGSAFGLDAASGVQAFLRENDRGFAVGPVKVPIVPTAIIFDLINGGKKDWGLYPPYRELGYDAAKAAASQFELGTVGAGTGALVAGLKGGLGSASLQLENGLTIGALFAVNALGSPLIGDTQNFHAAAFELNGEFGGHGFPSEPIPALTEPKIKFRDEQAALKNTTIGAIATNAKLTKAQAKRLATSAHAGIAKAIWPSHTPMDGDLVFSLATGENDIEINHNLWIDLAAHAISVTARAISRGVYCASARSGDLFPTYRQS